MTRRLIVTAAVKTIRMIITITMMIAPLGTSINDLTITVYIYTISIQKHHCSYILYMEVMK